MYRREDESFWDQSFRVSVSLQSDFGERDGIVFEREGSECEEYVWSICVWSMLFQVTSMPMITPSFHPDSAAASIALPVPHPRSQNPPPFPPPGPLPISILGTAFRRTERKGISSISPYVNASPPCKGTQEETRRQIDQDGEYDWVGSYEFWTSVSLGFRV